MNTIDLSTYNNKFSFLNKLKRLLWTIVWFLLAKPFPRRFANSWKLFLLRGFGAKVHKTAVVYSSVKIYAPWNLEMKEHACMAPEVDCYNVDKIVIGAHAIVSQKSYLCTASHDVQKSDYPLITKPIIIKDQAWVGAGAYINMGVEIGEGAVVGATASVYKNIEPWVIVGGNPAKFIKERKLNG
ncbi:putative colanic acid biosynthesis acetyltransferase [Winogradskyella psychrotolerans]|uniref:putative colanic acid biosynthesis acetyltransferase n=1 Tax=Winogradskyella psychrotolerans TaxID=1344585 RepID=UPI001C0707AC|nr:putative colanic acid biosynthesis acetyltransferase [Winogradskyella psychrotolerans]MBU2927577.1 putative colanic acid biosynthesis acetyltransferase [Winogradskyella psychrotolerans]